MPDCLWFHKKTSMIFFFFPVRMCKFVCLFRSLAQVCLCSSPQMCQRFFAALLHSVRSAGEPY